MTADVVTSHDWELLTVAPWRPRDSQGELVHDGSLWALGGYADELTSEVWRLASGGTAVFSRRRRCVRRGEPGA